jgi:hypothetical protein
MFSSAMDFLFEHWIKFAIAYGILYVTYVFYFLYSIRFKEVRRVSTRDFKEACGEAVFGFFILPCRMIGDALSAVKVSILAMVNVGLPPETPKSESEPWKVK